MKPLDFFEFIYDRQSVWHNRFILKQPRPWTKDDMLNTFKFCNVYRELDKGTQHVIEKVIDIPISEEAKIFNIIFYRRFNIFNFFGDIIPKPAVPRRFDFEFYEKTLDGAIRIGRKVFSEAYMFCGIPMFPHHRPSDKHVQVLLAMEDLAKGWDDFWDKFVSCKSIEQVTNLMQTLPLVGRFLAYQMAVDISYFKKYPDVNTFVVVGPGAKGGIEHLFGKSKNYENQCRNLHAAQCENWEKLNAKGKTWGSIYYNSPYNKGKTLEISLPNIQNSLCEFRKYINLQTKPNARKRYYKEATDELL